jgi:hypothetical protein
MRRGTSDTAFCFDESGKLVGVNLGYDFCAEHEWGTKKIQKAFGVGEGAEIGLETRKTTCVPKHFYYRTREENGQPEAMLLYNEFWQDNKDEIEKEIEFYFGGGCKEYNELRPYGDDWDIVAAWCENSFAIKVRGEENVKHLEAIRDAFNSSDIVFGQKQSFLSRGGLYLGLYSSYDDEFKNALIEQDKEHIELEEFVEKSGIRQELKEAKCRYYALSSAQWTDESKTEIKMWLNPMQQQDNNFGWYTIDELRQWAKGEGPIPKKEKAQV